MGSTTTRQTEQGRGALSHMANARFHLEGVILSRWGVWCGSCACPLIISTLNTWHIVVSGSRCLLTCSRCRDLRHLGRFCPRGFPIRVDSLTLRMWIYGSCRPMVPQLRLGRRCAICAISAPTCNFSRVSSYSITSWRAFTTCSRSGKFCLKPVRRC